MILKRCWCHEQHPETEMVTHHNQTNICTVRYVLLISCKPSCTASRMY